MPRTLMLLASLALFIPSLFGQATDTKTITITSKPFPVGTVVNSAMKGNGDMAQTVALGGQVLQEMKIKMNMTDKRRWTVMASDEKGVSKVRLDVLEAKEELEAEGIEPEALEDESNPLDGKSFIITRGEKDAAIEAVGEFEVTGDMTKAIKEDLHDATGSLISPSNGLEKLVERGSFTVGETITLGEKDLQRFMGGDEDLPAQSMTLEPKGTRSVLGSECCVFDVKIKAADPSVAADAMSADFSGEILIAKSTGWIQSMKFSGPLSMAMTEEHEGATIEMNGSGKMGIDFMSIYSKAALK